MIANQYEVERLAFEQSSGFVLVPGNRSVEAVILQDMLQGDQRVCVEVDNQNSARSLIHGLLLAVRGAIQGPTNFAPTSQQRRSATHEIQIQTATKRDIGIVRDTIITVCPLPHQTIQTETELGPLRQLKESFNYAVALAGSSFQ